MFKISGLLINIVSKSTYKNEQGLETPTKGKVQILVETKRANGNIVKELHTISVPDHKLIGFKDKLNKEIEVEVGIISKSTYSFYGV